MGRKRKLSLLAQFTHHKDLPTATRACTDSLCMHTAPVIADCNTGLHTAHPPCSHPIILLASPYGRGLLPVSLTSVCQRPTAHNHICQMPRSWDTWGHPFSTIQHLIVFQSSLKHQIHPSLVLILREGFPDLPGLQPFIWT